MADSGLPCLGTPDISLMLFLGSSLGEYAQAGLPPGVLGRKDVVSMKGTLLPVFQYLIFLMLPSRTWD